MPKSLPKVFALDIRNAELEGIKKLFTNWAKELGNEESIQAQWKAIAERLRDDPLMWAFREDSGVSANTINSWAKGESLPCPSMCQVYIDLVTKKIDDELHQMTEQRRKLLKPPEQKEVKEDSMLPSKAIVHFEIPDSLPAETEITELEGYYNLSTRVRDCLTNSNIVQAKDLLRSNRGRDSWQKVMLRTPNFGKVCLGELYQFMVKNGFKATLAE